MLAKQLNMVADSLALSGYPHCKGARFIKAFALIVKSGGRACGIWHLRLRPIPSKKEI